MSGSLIALLADPTFSSGAAVAKVAVPVAAKSSPIADYFTANWFNMASGICAVLALFFAAWSFKRSSSSAQVASQRADIASQYSQFTDFNRLRLEFPRQSHLMELPRHYGEISSQIREICRDESPSKRAELKIQERGIAILIFSMYEKILFDLQTFQNEGEGDTTFLEAVLVYLRSEWLRNPRLLYFWSEGGASLCSLFESSTRVDYAEQVAAFVKTDDMDVIGPFQPRVFHEASDPVPAPSL